MQRAQSLRKTAAEKNRKTENSPHARPQNLGGINITAFARKKNAAKPQSLGSTQNRPEISGILDRFESKAMRLRKLLQRAGLLHRADAEHSLTGVRTG